MHVILRTSWIYSPYGRNFVRTMVERIGQTDQVDVVDDEFGSPTYAVHLADAIFDIAEKISTDPAPSHWGIFHAAGAGRASWYDIAGRTFAAARAAHGPTPRVNPIKRTDYPVRAARPRNSCLDGSKLADVFDVRLPDWRGGVDDCVARILADRN
jgi:dTDP-4-dehydrorhamnose reductase